MGEHPFMKPHRSHSLSASSLVTPAEVTSWRCQCTRGCDEYPSYILATSRADFDNAGYLGVSPRCATAQLTYIFVVAGISHAQVIGVAEKATVHVKVHGAEAIAAALADKSARSARTLDTDRSEVHAIRAVATRLQGDSAVCTGSSPHGGE